MMKMNTTIGTVMVLWLGIWAFCPGHATADIAIDVDASFANAWYAYLYPDYWSAQSFTPTQRYLYAVESYHYPDNDVTGEFTLEIWAHDPAADPCHCRIGSEPLVRKTITRMKTAAQPDCWVRWALDTPLDVGDYIGTDESLLLYWTTPGSGAAPGMNDLGDVPPYAYLGGMRYFITDAGANWYRAPSWDMAFRTYGSEDPCELRDIILDQKQETATGWFNYQPDYWNGQAFDPNRPYLYAVEGYFSPNTSVTGEFTVEIWPNHSGLGGDADPRIGDAPLGTATITRIETGAQPDCWVRWDFSPAIDVTSQYESPYFQTLLILWKTQDIGPAMPYSDLDPYVDHGVRYWITNTSGDESTWTWTKYWGDDMMFRTYGAYGSAWQCGGSGSTFLAGDISGPDGVPDCYVNLHDLAVLSGSWLTCTDPENTACDEFWRVY